MCYSTLVKERLKKRPKKEKKDKWFRVKSSLFAPRSPSKGHHDVIAHARWRAAAQSAARILSIAQPNQDLGSDRACWRDCGADFLSITFSF
jgi:hypothetical protein